MCTPVCVCVYPGVCVPRYTLVGVCVCVRVTRTRAACDGRRERRDDDDDDDGDADDAVQGGVSYEILDELGRTRRGVRGRRAR